MSDRDSMISRSEEALLAKQKADRTRAPEDIKRWLMLTQLSNYEADFNEDKRFSDGIGVVELDYKKKLLAYYPNKNDAFRVFLSFDKLRDCEVFVDSDSVLKTDGVSLLSRAAVGGALTGGFGAVVMALGAKKKSITLTKTIEVRVTTQVASMPSFTLVAFQNSRGADASLHMKEAVLWHNAISMAIQDGREITSHVDPTPQTQPPQAAPVHAQVASGSSVADELRKLASLRAEGIITEAEFTVMKSKLIQL